MSKGHVLVTRPAGQADWLCRRLQELGYQVSHRPVLSIEPLPLSDTGRSLLMDLDQFHAVFVVSSNAARLAVDALADYWPQWPVGVHWIAVGDATAACLSQAGLQPWLPDAGFNSEAVLALPPLQDVADKRVLVLRGDKGRELFADTLRQRGARVDMVPLYRRDCDTGFSWPQEKVDTLLVTSLQSWQCLLQYAIPPGEVSVLAGSERIAVAVREAGYQRVRVAASPRDEDMLATLVAAEKNHQEDQA